MILRRLFPLLVLACVVALSACQKVKAFRGCVDSVFSSSRVDEGPLLARVGDYTVTVADFNDNVRMIPAANRDFLKTPEGRQSLLQNLIRQKLFVIGAQQSGVESDPAVQQQLRSIRETTLTAAYLQSLRSKELRVSDEEVQHYYDQHKNDRSLSTEEHPTFEALKTPIRQRLEYEKLEKILDGVKRAVKIDIDEKQLASLPTP